MELKQDNSYLKIILYPISIFFEDVKASWILFMHTINDNQITLSIPAISFITSNVYVNILLINTFCHVAFMKQHCIWIAAKFLLSHSMNVPHRMKQNRS